MMVACRPGHPKQDSKTWASLLACDWLVHPSQDASTVHEFLRKHGVDVERQLIRTNTFAATWSILTQTDTLFLCPVLMLGMPVYGELVRRVPVPVAMPRLTLGIIRLKDAPLSHVAEVLSMMFERELRDLKWSAPGKGKAPKASVGL